VSTRRPTQRIAAAALGLLLALSAAACSSSGDKATAKPKATTTRAAATTAPAPTTAPGVDPNTPGAPAPESLVAHASIPQVPIFDAPNGQQINTLANPIASGAPLVFLIVGQQPDWLNVMLPTRPNGSTGWIKATDATVSAHHYRMDVVLSKHLITVMDGANVLLQTPIAVGTSDTPTPAQTFFTTELLKPVDESGTYIPEGDYGPFAYGLSGHSDVLQSFGGGDGQLGIHGTNQPELIGTDVSHGCIRMSNDDITKLAGILPLGVPVRIFP
jgi:lipoprotein-anchoring transpeptidase ErfK/SrfK